MPKFDLIAICEDDKDVRDAVDTIVKSLGYKTAVFFSAEQFLYSGLASTTTCLITDMRMPGMNGAELHGRLCAQGYSIPTIVVSGDCSDPMRARLLAAGAVDVLPKPFDDRALSAALERALGRRGSACKG
jgi:FixJ family two-component response regulator